MFSYVMFGWQPHWGLDKWMKSWKHGFFCFSSDCNYVAIVLEEVGDVLGECHFVHCGKRSIGSLGSGADTPFIGLQMLFSAAGKADRLVHLQLGCLWVGCFGNSFLLASSYSPAKEYFRFWQRKNTVVGSIQFRLWGLLQRSILQSGSFWRTTSIFLSSLV